MADWFFCDAGFGFEFPYNLWGAILLVVGCIVFSLFGNRRCLRSMTGIGFTLVWMAVLAVFLVAEGIGGWKLYHTWGGILLWLVFLFHLGLVILRRLRKWNLRNALFFLNHTGIWLVVAATFLGAPDVKRVKMLLPLGQAENRALDENGYIHSLFFRVLLQKFQVEYFDDDRSVPKNFRAELLLQSPNETKRVELDVNKPVRFEGYAFYIEGYDQQLGSASEYVTLQLVRDPWEHIVYWGILMMLAGSVGLIIYGPIRRKRDERDLE